MTAEDPIEYDLGGTIQQFPVIRKGQTFANLLRTFLRQDPDVILIGENEIQRQPNRQWMQQKLGT